MFFICFMVFKNNGMVAEADAIKNLTALDCMAVDVAIANVYVDEPSQTSFQRI